MLNKRKMKPQLIIAGAGYLGQEIARQAHPHFQVLTLNKSGEDADATCDLTSPTDVAKIAAQIPNPAAIIHCASSGRGGPSAYRDVFLTGSQNLHTHFPKTQIILTSSTSVYHQTNGEEVDESSPTEPIRENSQILLQAEKFILETGGSIARLAGLYGPHRSAVLRKFLDGTAVIEDQGQRILNQIHVTDAASATLHLALSKHLGIYNISDNEPISQLACYQGLATHFNKPLPPRGEKNTNRKRAWTHKKVLNQKIRNTGWQPTYPSYLSALASLPTS